MSADSRRASRDSERRRRALGKAETPEHQRERYAASPEPQRQAMRGYYQANKDQILEARAGYYASNRAAILAAKADRYQANREQILARRRAARRAAAAATDAPSVAEVITLPALPPPPPPPQRIRRGQFELAHHWSHVPGPPVLLTADDLTPLSGALPSCPVCRAPARLVKFEGQAVLLIGHRPGCRAFRAMLARP